MVIYYYRKDKMNFLYKILKWKKKETIASDSTLMKNDDFVQMKMNHGTHNARSLLDQFLLDEIDYMTYVERQYACSNSVVRQNSADFIHHKDKYLRLLNLALESEDDLKSDVIIEQMEVDAPAFLNELNQLLIDPRHQSHQIVAKMLQDDAPSPTTVPYVRVVLESDFSYLAYTCSEKCAIAKWFSHLLFAIGTKEAIDLIREYAKCKDAQIAQEMQYRLKQHNLV